MAAKYSGLQRAWAETRPGTFRGKIRGGRKITKRLLFNCAKTFMIALKKTKMPAQLTFLPA